jgi:acyl-coenzyme A thioesterase PaaI-like protein
LHCAVCGAGDPLGLGLEFEAETDGTMSVQVRDGSRLQGYPHRLHGGIVATLFDAAMTHCLFARGLEGVTGSLNIRFLLPVDPVHPVIVRARVVKRKSRLCLLYGTLQQDGETKCKAEARFWIVSDAAEGSA